jgi:hypothetical protein
LSPAEVCSGQPAPEWRRRRSGMTNSVPDLKVQNIRRTRSTEAVVVQEFDCIFHPLPPIAHTLRRIPGIRWRVAGTLGSAREILGSGAGAIRNVGGTLESMANTLRSMGGMFWDVREPLQSKAGTVDSVREILRSRAGTLHSVGQTLGSMVGSLWYVGRSVAGMMMIGGYPESDIWPRFLASTVLRPTHEGRSAAMRLVRHQACQSPRKLQSGVGGELAGRAGTSERLQTRFYAFCENVNGSRWSCLPQEKRQDSVSGHKAKLRIRMRLGSPAGQSKIKTLTMIEGNKWQK